MDLIDREKLKELLESEINDCESIMVRPSFWTALSFINDLPTVEAKEVVHGYVKTVVGKMGVMHQECSACGNVLEWKAYPNYCDECGAKLDGADMRTSAE